MTSGKSTPDEERVASGREIARGAASKPARPPLLLSGLISEVDSWVQDDRQWRSGGAEHWRSLIGDLRTAIAFVGSLSDSPIQDRLSALHAELETIDKGFSNKGTGPPDEVLRRRLRRTVNAVNAAAVEDSLILSAWERAIDWAASGKPQADDARGMLRHLDKLCGHDPDTLFARIDGTLSDNGLEVALARGGGAGPPQRPRAAAQHGRLSSRHGRQPMAGHQALRPHDLS